MGDPGLEQNSHGGGVPANLSPETRPSDPLHAQHHVEPPHAPHHVGEMAAVAHLDREGYEG